MFRKNRSVGIRIWHWANSAAIFLLLATVFLRETFLGKENKNIILAKGQELGVLLSDMQAGEIARAIRNEMWQWHPVIGFVAIGLLIFRLFIYFKTPSSSSDSTSKPLMYKLVKKTHALFYFFLAVMGVTGGVLYWGETLQLGKGFIHNVEELHEALQWFFILFIIGHIVGVIKAELTDDKGLISEMINGGE